MKPYFEEKGITILNADCRDALRELADHSVDSIVTDAPYELGFMGKGWDRSGIAYDVSVWLECLRVLRPGGHLLAFGGSRTYHRLACAIEDAGFEIRDQVQWIYGSGFPKSLDVSKAIDAAAGAERSGTGETVRAGCRAARDGGELVGSATIETAKWKEVTVPATDAAKQWNGWGTALKPAHEPIVLARKPLIGTVAQNVLEHGTGGLNIDGCRIETQIADALVRDGRNGQTDRTASGYNGGWRGDGLKRGGVSEGRWPANVIHDGSDEVLAGFPETVSGSGVKNPVGGTSMWERGSNWRDSGAYEGDSGSAARFFYCAKASKKDRDEGLDSLPMLPAGALKSGDGGWRNEEARGRQPRHAAQHTARNHHPTVKPTQLMRYLVRLVTPPGGTVLDPFGGSGSTAKACRLEGFNCILIEKEAEYCALAASRLPKVRTLNFEAVA